MKAQILHSFCTFSYGIPYAALSVKARKLLNLKIIEVVLRLLRWF